MIKKCKNEKIKDTDCVSVKECGSQITITKCKNKNTYARIKKIDKDNFYNLATGEVLPFKHTSSRADCIASLKKSMKNLSDLINTNTTLAPNKCLFITLTYANEMRDKSKVAKDFKAFMQRINAKKWKATLNFNNVEYISVYEIQARGTYHIHAILIFDRPNMFISSKNLEILWGKGFAKAKKLYQNCDDFGKYFEAQFSNVGLAEARRAGVKISNYKDKIVEKTIIGPRNGKQSKKVIKGLRFQFMEPNKKFYSYSKGILKPVIDKDVLYKNAKVRINGKKLKKATSFAITNDKNKVVNTIIKEIYN